jgi:hypothetical protein
LAVWTKTQTQLGTAAFIYSLKLSRSFLQAIVTLQGLTNSGCGLSGIQGSWWQFDRQDKGFLSQPAPLLFLHADELVKPGRG